MFFSVVDARRRAGLFGMLLGRQAEGVPAHRMQHALAPHPLIAADDVGGRLPFGMADVQAVAAGIGEHVEDVEFPVPAASRMANVRSPPNSVAISVRSAGLYRGMS